MKEQDAAHSFPNTPMEKKSAEEILDALESTDDGYIHYSVLLPVITRLRSELQQAK